MKASWLSSCAASRPVKWAPERTLMRVAVASALADSSSTISTLGASSGPKCLVTPASMMPATSSAEWSRTTSCVRPTWSSPARTSWTR